MLAILFINVYKGHSKVQTGTSSNSLDFGEFYVVAEVVSFVVNPVIYLISRFEEMAVRCLE